MWLVAGYALNFCWSCVLIDLKTNGLFCRASVHENVIVAEHHNGIKSSKTYLLLFLCLFTLSLRSCRQNLGRLSPKSVAIGHAQWNKSSRNIVCAVFLPLCLPV